LVISSTLVPRNNCLFIDDAARIRLFPIIALTRHPRAALAAQLFVPWQIRVVFTDPPYAKTNRTVFIHGI
jgi:16S rRNA G966 N2-methylase RsmD